MFLSVSVSLFVGFCKVEVVVVAIVVGRMEVGSGLVAILDSVEVIRIAGVRR